MANHVDHDQIRHCILWHLTWVYTVCWLLSVQIFVINAFYQPLFEPDHDKTYNKTCATSKDSDQPAHLHTLIRVLADHICLLQPSGYPKRNKWEHLSYWRMFRLIWVFADHTGLIVGFVVCWHILLFFKWLSNEPDSQTSAQSNQFPLSSWRNYASLSIQNVPSEDSDQTDQNAQMRSLIWIFIGHTYLKLHFLTLWLR